MVEPEFSLAFDLGFGWKCNRVGHNEPDLAVEPFHDVVDFPAAELEWMVLHLSEGFGALSMQVWYFSRVDHMDEIYLADDATDRQWIGRQCYASFCQIGNGALQIALIRQACMDEDGTTEGAQGSGSVLNGLYCHAWHPAGFAEKV